MEDEKLAAYYDELTRKGGGAARFKQGLGYSSSTNDVVPSRGSALSTTASSFLSKFVKASSPSKSSQFEKQAQLQSVQNKLSKKPRGKIRSPSPSPSPSPSRDEQIRNSSRRSLSPSPIRDRSRDRHSRRRSRSRDRYSRRRSRSRSRDRRSRRRSRERSKRRSRSGSPEKGKEQGEIRNNGRKGGGIDFAKLIDGYCNMMGDRIDPANDPNVVLTEAPQIPGIQSQDLRRATDFLLDNDRIGNVRTHYKYPRYVELNVDTMFTALVGLYATMFRSQWHSFKTLLDAFTVPAGTDAYTYAARVYISHWFIDLYCSIREATRVISPLAFNEMYDFEFVPYSNEYDAYLSLLNAAIRPTRVQYASEDALYIPTFCKPTEGFIWDTNEDALNPFTITNFRVNHDIFYGMIQVMKERKQWKFLQISTHSMGRPSWLFDWHDNNKVCAWFPREGNYDDTDVTLAYIIGAPCTPKLGPRDVDDWMFDTPPSGPQTIPTHDLPRVVSRRFYGSYEVRAIECELDYRVPEVIQDYLEGLGVEAAKKKKAKKGKEPAAATSAAGGVTQPQPSAPHETESTSELTLPNFPRFRLVDWCYYSLVVVNIEWHTRTGALRTLIMS